PWVSDLGAASTRSAPLRALFVLNQAPTNATRPLAPAPLLDALLSCISIPIYDERALDFHLAAAQSLARESAGYQLDFTPIEGVFDAIQAI
ncbi:MAG: hypothetical protein AAFQ82_24720, partial [Myxococcota bacterium]